MDNTDNVALEQMVDRHGLSAVLQMLAEICGEKADHLRSNWQDSAAAKRWEKAGRAVDKASGNAAVSDVL